MMIRTFCICILGLDAGKITVEIDDTHLVSQLKQEIWNKVHDASELKRMTSRRLCVYKTTTTTGLMFRDPSLEKKGQKYVNDLIEKAREEGKKADIDAGLRINLVFPGKYWASLQQQGLVPVHVFVTFPQTEASFDRLWADDLFSDIYHKFWGIPLKLEQHSITSTDEEGIPTEMSFNALKIDSRIFESTKGKMIVRKEYLETVANLENRFTSFPKTGGLVLGHPGIGKYWFLFYLLALRLSQKKPTIINTDPADDIILYNENGCYKSTGRTAGDIRNTPLPESLWILLYSPNPNVGPNPLLTSHSTRFFTGFYTEVMRPWTFDEIWAAAILRRSSDQTDREVLRSQYWKYGPSPRTLFKLYDGQVTPDKLDRQIKNIIDCIKIDDLQRLIDKATAGPPTGNYDSVIHAYPHPEDRNWIAAGIISRSVFQLIVDQLFTKGFQDLVKAYQLFYRIDSIGDSAGWTFEHYCHRMLSEHHGRDLRLVPFEDIETTSDKEGPLRHYRPGATTTPLWFPITMRWQHHFQRGQTPTLSRGMCCIRSPSNNPTCDAFMVLEEQDTRAALESQTVIVFQTTTKAEYEVKPAVLEELQKYVPDRSLIFVLLVPKEREKDDIKLSLPEEISNKARYCMSLVEVRAEA